MALTAKRVIKLLRRGEPGRYLDKRGLYLCVQSTTAANWLKRYQLDGRERYHGLGSAFSFSLVEARERNRRAGQLLEDGVDPIEQKRQQKAERVAEKARTVTFGECATDFFRAHSPSWGHPKHVAQWRASVLGLTAIGKPAEADCCKVLRPLPVRSIDTPLVLSVLKTHWHDKPESMSRVRARIASVLDYATAAGFRAGDNPAAWNIIGRLLPAPNKLAPANHHPAIDYRVMPAFMQALRARQGTTARCLQFLVYTCARSTEAREATWREIVDLDGPNPRWVIPPQRMKADKEHKVPLAPEVVKLLRDLPREDDSPDSLVFIGTQPGKPLSDAALRALMRRMGRSEVPHGCRSTFSTWASEATAYPNHVIEQSLAHAIGSAVERAYRRGDLFKKRRRLMTDWTKYCASPVVAQKAGEVVGIGRGR